MISAIVYDRIQEELNFIEDTISDIIADRSEDESRMDYFGTLGEFLTGIEETSLADFICIDICGRDGTKTAELVRRKFPETRLLLIADSTIPPNLYIRPSIIPSSLILRPVSGEDIRRTLEEFVGSFLDTIKEAGEDVFLLETKEGITKIPFRQIYCFESSRKKIFIRLKNEEYSYYYTLDKLMETLPQQFIRCHKSYIANRQRIVRYDATNAEIIMDDDTIVPVSKSYRSEIRELLKK